MASSRVAPLHNGTSASNFGTQIRRSILLIVTTAASPYFSSTDIFTASSLHSRGVRQTDGGNLERGTQKRRLARATSTPFTPDEGIKHNSQNKERGGGGGGAGLPEPSPVEWQALVAADDAPKPMHGQLSSITFVIAPPTLSPPFPSFDGRAPHRETSAGGRGPWRSPRK